MLRTFHARLMLATRGTQDMMCQGERLESVLRLLALMSVTGGGLPKKHFDALRREVLHTYGHENILTISSMQDAGTGPTSGPDYHPCTFQSRLLHRAWLFWSHTSLRLRYDVAMAVQC